jgi:hypothetical protein
MLDMSRHLTKLDQQMALAPKVVLEVREMRFVLIFLALILSSVQVTAEQLDSKS